jgi:hypothetical protein
MGVRLVLSLLSALPLCKDRKQFGLEMSDKGVLRNAGSDVLSETMLKNQPTSF